MREVCKLFCLHRTVEVVLMFGVRACVTGAFQAAYVYTPEVSSQNLFDEPKNVKLFGVHLENMRVIPQIFKTNLLIYLSKVNLGVKI